MQGLLQLNHEAVHHVEEVKNVVVQLRSKIVYSIYEAALRDPEMDHTVVLQC